MKAEDLQAGLITPIEGGYETSYIHNAKECMIITYTMSCSSLLRP